MSNLPAILTPDQVAEYFKVDRDVVLKELAEGRLKGFKIGTEWRCTDASLLEYINNTMGQSAAMNPYTEVPRYEESTFAEIGPFDYQWPSVKEHFEKGYETTRTINGRSYLFRVGYTNRRVAGRLRRRVVVWIDNWPLVEFAGSNNYESDGLLASIIKDKNGKQIRPGSRIPEEYKNFRIAQYNSIVQGPFASKNMAIVVTKDDLDTMLRHAIIRARWKGRI